MRVHQTIQSRVGPGHVFDFASSILLSFGLCRELDVTCSQISFGLNHQHLFDHKINHIIYNI